MRAVVQRVSEASVMVGEEIVGETGAGLVVLLGAADGDGEDDVQYLLDKVVHLRVFEDDAGRMNLSLLDVGGALLVVSQFTLLGDCRKGRRPSFSHALEPVRAEVLYEQFVALAKARGVSVATGRFGAMMSVRLANDGPVTLLIDSRREF